MDEILKSSSPEPQCHYQPNMDQNKTLVKGIQVCSNVGAKVLFQGESIMKQRKYMDEKSSPEPMPISTKHGTDLVKGIQICSTKGHTISQGEIITKQEIYMDEIQKSSSEPMGQLQFIFDTKHFLVKGIRVINKGSRPFPRDNIKIAKKYVDKIFKIHLLQNHCANYQTWHKTFLGEGDVSFYILRTI